MRNFSFTHIGRLGSFVWWQNICNLIAWYLDFYVKIEGLFPKLLDTVTPRSGCRFEKFFSGTHDFLSLTMQLEERNEHGNSWVLRKIQLWVGQWTTGKTVACIIPKWPFEHGEGAYSFICYLTGISRCDCFLRRTLPFLKDHFRVTPITISGLIKVISSMYALRLI